MVTLLIIGPRERFRFAAMPIVVEAVNLFKKTHRKKVQFQHPNSEDSDSEIASFLRTEN